MRRVFLLFLAALTAAAATDAWEKVRQVKGGTEIRIFRKGAKQPVLATMDEATEDRISIATKKEQLSIPKDEIDRIDARPDRGGDRVKKETKVEDSGKPARPGVPQEHPGPNRSYSSNVTFEGKPDFETIYRRTPMLGPLKK
jgi:hypothetical protein